MAASTDEISHGWLPAITHNVGPELFPATPIIGISICPAIVSATTNFVLVSFPASNLTPAMKNSGISCRLCIQQVFASGI
jgi:hypothetical protein